MKSSLKRYAWTGFGLGALGLLAAAALRLVYGKFEIYGQISLAVGLLGLAAGLIMNPERIQTWLTGRQARFGSNALVMSLAVFGILVTLNVLAKNYTKSWDLTEDKEFTLDSKTVEIAKGLKEPVLITGYYSPRAASERDQAQTLLEQYKNASGGKITYRFFDPYVESAQATAAQITQDGELVLESAGHTERVTTVEEQDISSALLKLNNPETKVVYFLNGEGERSVDEGAEAGLSEAKARLERLNYKVDTLSLLISATVPTDASVVVIAAPTSPLTQDAVSALDNYLKSGGGVIYLAEPVVVDAQTPPDSLADYLSANWGISIQHDLVIDSQSTSIAVPIVVPAQGHGTYEFSPITDRVSQNGLATYFPTSRSLTVQTLGDRSAQPLLGTAAAPDVWGETDFASLTAQERPTYDEASDHPGPLTLAASAEDGATQGRVVVFGDVDFASNQFLSDLGNGDLFNGAVNWASGQADLLALPPRDRTSRFVVPPSAIVTNLILLVTVFGLPLAVLAGGGVVWFQRRRHG